MVIEEQEEKEKEEEEVEETEKPKKENGGLECFSVRLIQKDDDLSLIIMRNSFRIMVNQIKIHPSTAFEFNQNFCEKGEQWANFSPLKLNLKGLKI